MGRCRTGQNQRRRRIVSKTTVNVARDQEQDARASDPVPPVGEAFGICPPEGCILCVLQDTPVVTRITA